MKYIIVTGDDFGLSAPVNEAIEEACRRGILTTASLMVGEPAAEDAVRRARELPSLRVGLHLVLVDGRPVLPPREIPDLVDGNGNFRRGLTAAGIRFFFLPRVRRQLAAEIRAQFEAFRRTGLPIDHVNAHHHMQLHPTILRLILEEGRSRGRPPVRLPSEPFLPSWGAAGDRMARRLLSRLLLAPWAGLARRRLRRAGVMRNDHLFGMNDAGRLGKERVVRLIARLPRGVSEIHFHPGSAGVQGRAAAGDRRDEELEALTCPEVADALRAAGVAGIDFGDLSERRA